MRYIINKGCSILVFFCNGLLNCMFVYGIFGDCIIDGCKNVFLVLIIWYWVIIRLYVYKGWVYFIIGLFCIL